MSGMEVINTKFIAKITLIPYQRAAIIFNSGFNSYQKIDLYRSTTAHNPFITTNQDHAQQQMYTS